MINSNIDYLIVGAGLYGATIARLLTDKGYKCFIIDKRNHIAGNIYSEKIYDKYNNYIYDKHVYGPHIFHTNDDNVIKFVKKYSNWNNYIQNTLATDGYKLYHLPFNMNTYYEIFGVTTPQEAKNIIEKEITESKIINPKNLEEQAISIVGKTIYEKLIKNYTEKQWNKKCSELNKDIIKRLPVRYNFNNNYFNDKFQAIPDNGYTDFIMNMISDIPYLCDIEFSINDYSYFNNHIKYKIIYCGTIDKLLNYELGELSWRSLLFEDKKYTFNGINSQGTSIINDVSKNSQTRTIEHMWFKPNNVHEGITSIVTTEYPDDFKKGKEAYYPINNDDTQQLYSKYVKYMQNNFPKIYLGGRLGKYKYLDMDDTILEAMNDFNLLEILKFY